MFCSQCGKAIPDQAKFCPSCGAANAVASGAMPVAATPAPATVAAADFTGLRANLTVRLQGADASLQANGSYDEVALGVVTPQRLLEILRTLWPQTPQEGDDICPINVLVTGPQDETSFTIDSGRITSGSGGTEYTPEDAVRKVLGQATQAKVKLPAGWKPVRRSELPPTNRDEADPTKIDLSSQPQASAKIWVGDFAPWLHAMSWVGVGMAVLVLPGCFDPFRPGLFFGALAVAGLLVWGARFARRCGYQEMRLGVDWGTNTFWVNVEGKTHLTPDASCVRDFQLVERTRTTTRGTGLKKQTHTKTVYLLAVSMSTGKTEIVRGLPEFAKRKANEVLGAARGLLARL